LITELNYNVVGSEDENPEDSWADLRETDMVALLNQIPIDYMFR
jgi:hypothetical protein